MDELNTCIHCGEEKVVALFSKVTDRPKPYSNVCRVCFAKRVRAYAAANPERVKQIARRTYKKNIKKRRASDRARQQIRAEQKRHKIKNDPIFTAKLRKTAKAWKLKNPDKIVATGHNRRARLLAGGTFTAEEWSQLKAKHDFRCLCCRKFEPEIKLTPDHVLPVAKGGLNTIENIQPLCILCNQIKQARFMDFRKLYARFQEEGQSAADEICADPRKYYPPYSSSTGTAGSTSLSI